MHEPNKQDATQRFIARRTGGRVVVVAKKTRCPHCNEVVTGRSQRSERFGDQSLQWRKCAACCGKFCVVTE